MANYKVVVGNIGVIYDGSNGFEAIKQFNACVGLSKSPHGRASGEDVTLFRDDDIYKEHCGMQHEEEE